MAARALLEAELLEQPRFGLDLLDEFATDAQVRLGADADAALSWLDASRSFAPRALADAALELARRTRTLGVALTWLRGVRGFGRLAPFVRSIADQGQVAFACAHSMPFVAPHGGLRAVIGTNPWALAAGKGAHQLVIDTATAAATMAQLRAARRDGLALDPGVAIDTNGQATTVADAVAALLPRGGTTGSLAGLLVEVLAGVLSGGRGDDQGRGVLLLSLDAEQSPAGAQGTWQETLEELGRQWGKAGGHWPQGQPLDGNTPLGPRQLERLHAALNKLARRNP